MKTLFFKRKRKRIGVTSDTPTSVFKTSSGILDTTWLDAVHKVLDLNNPAFLEAAKSKTSFDNYIDTIQLYAKSKSEKNPYLSVYDNYILNYASLIQKYLSSQKLLLLREGKAKKLSHELIQRARYLLEDLNSTEDLENPNLNLLKITEFLLNSKNINKEEERDKIIEIMFCTGVVILSHLIEFESIEKRNNEDQLIENDPDKKSYKGKEKGNFIPILKGLAENFLTQMMLEVHENKNIFDRKQVDSFVTIYSRDEKQIVFLGQVILTIFQNLNLVKVNKFLYKGKYRKNVSYSEEGLEFFIEFAKYDHWPADKLPMLHYPFAITETFKGSGLREIETDLPWDTPIIKKFTGCKITHYSNSIPLIITKLSRMPLNINISFFKVMLAKTVGEYESELLNLDPIWTEIFKHIPSPITSEKDKIRVKFMNTRFFYILLVSALLYKIVLDKTTILSKIKELDLNKFIERYINFFFTLKMDSRGRFYTNAVLSYQGSQWEKSLFSTSYKPLNKIGIECIINGFITYYGSDFEGNSVKTWSWNQKINYFEKNFDTFKNAVLIESAAKPFLFAIIYGKLAELGLWDQSTFNIKFLLEKETNLLMFLDNTSSGSQILATLIGEDNSNILSLLNLTNQNFDDNIGDFYSMIATEANEFLKMEKNNQKYPKILKEIAKDKIITNFFTRSLIKEGCLASFYGISSTKIAKSLISAVHRKSEFKADKEIDWDIIRTYLMKYYKMTRNIRKTNIKLVKYKPLDTLANEGLLKEPTFREYIKTLPEEDQNLILPQIETKKRYLKISLALAKILMLVIRTKLKKVFVFYDTINDYNVIIAANKLGFTWTTPTNDLSINQFYEIETITKAKLLKKGETVNIRKVQKGKINENKQVISLMANITHSLDSAILRSVVENSGNIVKGTIHDNYLIHPSDYEKFMTIYKTCFYNFFSEDNIKVFFDSLPKPQNKEITKTPKKPFKKIVKEDIYEIHQKLEQLLLDSKTIENRNNLRENITKSKYILYF